MIRVQTFLCVLALTMCLSIGLASNANAQYPVAVAPVTVAAPAVIGYAPERRGLFGLRTVYRPVVSSVVAPVGTAPVVSYFAPPVIAPVTTYRIPVQSYRVPVTTYMPVFGF